MNRPQTKTQDIENRFTYHKPFGTQPQRYESIRSHAKRFALFIADVCPPSRELSLALTHLEDSVFWANAAIARNEQPVEEQKGTEPPV